VGRRPSPAKGPGGRLADELASCCSSASSIAARKLQASKGTSSEAGADGRASGRATRQQIRLARGGARQPTSRSARLPPPHPTPSGSSTARPPAAAKPDAAAAAEEAARGETSTAGPPTPGPGPDHRKQPCAAPWRPPQPP
jgi:hypothetical protein